MAAFTKEYSAVLNSCNDSHAGMGYDIIEVVRLPAPPDQMIEYKVSSKTADVPR